MKLASEKARTVVAGEYVLGTLHGRARRRFERMLRHDITLRPFVEFWEQALLDLTADVQPEKPPSRIWEAIELRLGMKTNAGMPYELPRWRRWVLPVFLGVVLGSTVALLEKQWLPGFDPEVQLVVSNEQQQALWQVGIDQRQGMLEVEPRADIPVEPDRSLELWLLRPGDLAPVSLGLMPTQKGRVQRLTTTADLRGGVGLAVSLEPKGGSPTGAPTGPVLYVQKFATQG